MPLCPSGRRWLVRACRPAAGWRALAGSGNCQELARGLVACAHARTRHPCANRRILRLPRVAAHRQNPVRRDRFVQHASQSSRRQHCSDPQPAGVGLLRRSHSLRRSNRKQAMRVRHHSANSCARPMKCCVRSGFCKGTLGSGRSLAAGGKHHPFAASSADSTHRLGSSVSCLANTSARSAPWASLNRLPSSTRCSVRAAARTPRFRGRPDLAEGRSRPPQIAALRRPVTAGAEPRLARDRTSIRGFASANREKE